jgi:hypothetical protein
MLSHGLTPLFQTASPAGNMVKAAFPLFLTISCGVIALQPELRLAVPMLTGSTALMALLLAFALFWGDRGKPLWSPAVILGVALLLRLFFLFAPAQLSDDIYRYLWDGGNLLRGVNPFAAAPAKISPPRELKAVHSRINHPEYVTIYPPAAQLIFAGGAALGGGVTGLKTLLVFFDLALCVLIMALLRRLELPVWRSVLYAWNPLPVVEIAGSGHVDGAGLALLMGAILFLLPRQRGAMVEPLRWPYIGSGALLAGASLVKVYPLILAPLLFPLLPKARCIHFLAGLLGGMALLLFPFLPHLANLAGTLDVYARNWEFSGFAFNILRGVTGSGTAARIILAVSLCSVIAILTLRAFKKARELEAPKGAGREVMTGCYASAMAFLLLTPTLHPWYALTLAVFLPFCAGPAGLVLCWSLFLTYRVQIGYFIIGEWNESASVTAVVALAPVAALVLSRLIKGGGLGTKERGSGSIHDQKA